MTPTSPIFLIIMCAISCIITAQFLIAKNYPMVVIWFGMAITEGGFIWYALQGAK